MRTPLINPDTQKMKKLSHLLLGVITVWQISLTSSTKRFITGQTQGDHARTTLYVIAIASTAGALMQRRSDG